MTRSTAVDHVFLGRRRLHGIGLRATLPAARAARPEAIPAAMQLLRETERADGIRRVIMGQIPFDPDEPAHLVVPAHVEEADIAAQGSGSPSGPVPGIPDDPHYRDAVRAAVGRIREGRVRKVVLARSMTLRSDVPVDTLRLLAAFARRSPEAYSFHMPLRDGGVIVGASPELVADVVDGALRSHPLAGSAPKTGDENGNRLAARALLSSAKDSHEHALLVTTLAADLDRITTVLRVPAAPAILETDRLLHLGTAIEGRLRDGVTALEAAYTVHPTAAVGGVPTASATALIAELEGEERGAYAGLVGWMDSDGDGEWALALRCAVVSDRTIHVHAGAGIVADSDADAEHAETAAKLRTALGALSDIGVFAPVEAVRA